MTSSSSSVDAVSASSAFSDSTVPALPRTILVPLSHPEVVIDVLMVARALAHPRTSRLVVLNVMEGNAESQVEIFDALQELIDTFEARTGHGTVELVTRSAIGVARGILDTARDERAEMILLNIDPTLEEDDPDDDDDLVSPIIGQVIAAADCDVVVYRRSTKNTPITDVASIHVGVVDSPVSRTASHTAVQLGERFSIPLDFVHVAKPGANAPDDLLATALAPLRLEGRGNRRVIEAKKTSAGLETLATNGLTVIGLRPHRERDGEWMGATTNAALERLKGPVLAVWRDVEQDAGRPIKEQFLRQFRPRMTDAEERQLIAEARSTATLSGDFMVLSVIAGVIATLGLLLNSAAVIIGAMLVAPLMGPIVAFGTALVSGDMVTLRRSAVTTAAGTFLVTGTAILLGLVFGTETPTPEMASRGSPSLIDAGVAIASGVIGGYAQARKGIPSALAGVAIAAALVPPVCVAGLAVSLDWRLATGSALLFLTNISCIAASAGVVLYWLGVKPGSVAAKRKQYLRSFGPVVSAVLVAVVMFGLMQTGPYLEGIEHAVVDALGDTVEVVSSETSSEGDVVTVTIRSTEPPTQAAVQRTVDRVRDEYAVDLRIVVQELLTGQ